MYISSTVWFTFIMLYFHVVESSHFRGGFISWKPAENNQIEINYRVAFRRSVNSHMCDENTKDNGTINPGGNLQCMKGCSGSISSMSYYCTDFSDTEKWTTGTNSVKYNPTASSDNLYHFGFTGCCWITLVEGGSNWMMRTTADLNKRKDTGKINTSPISAMQPIVRFNYGCDYTLKIPVSDDDRDVVRCRWSTKTPNDECGGVCQALNGSYLDESACVLSYNATSSLGWYAVALQIEDFQKSSDTVPLSSVPLQFLVVVARSSELCTSRPVLPPNIITDGSIHHIPVNTIFNESIVARSGGETLRQSSDQTCATLVVDDHVVSQVTENLESDAVVVLNPSCSAFKTPEKVRNKCIEAVSAVPPLFYLESSCPSHFVQCNEFGVGYIMPCAPGTEWCQQKLTCDRVGSCKT